MLAETPEAAAAAQLTVTGVPAARASATHGGAHVLGAPVATEAPLHGGTGDPYATAEDGPLGADAFRAFRLASRSVVARDFVQLTLALPAGVEVRGDPPGLATPAP